MFSSLPERQKDALCLFVRKCVHENKKKDKFRKAALNAREKRISQGPVENQRCTTREESSDSSENEIEEF